MRAATLVFFDLYLCEMSNYRKGLHTRYDLKIHIVWITKYRKPVLHGAIAKRVRELMRETCLANEIQIVKGHVSKDRVHLLISYGAATVRHVYQ